MPVARAATNVGVIGQILGVFTQFQPYLFKNLFSTFFDHGLGYPKKV